jgi:hypothetical protein
MNAAQGGTMWRYFSLQLCREEINGPFRNANN